MNNITDSFFDAMKIFADNAMDISTSTKTISCIIDSKIEDGKYSVKYLGNFFIAFDNQFVYNYQKGDIVYVLLPEGDLSKEKLIIGPAKGSSPEKMEVWLSQSEYDKLPSSKFSNNVTYFIYED